MIGTSIPRVEDAALVTGEAEFADDAPLPPDAGHACFVRSPWPHADIAAIDARAALAMDGVHAVLTGPDAAAWSDPLLVGVRAPVEHRCLATERVRYAGEPVAVVVACDRYVAEDAAERVEVDYVPRPAIVDPEEALGETAPVLHEAMGSNLVHERRFRYGDPEAAFRAAAHRVVVDIRYPRNVCTPIETIVVTASWLPADGTYEVHSNFQGPYSLHPVMARALRVPGSRLRLRAARNSGGSFGVKQSAFVDIVALALAARAAGRPVRFVQDRMENLSAATSATNRVVRLEAAVERDGRVRAFRYDQVEDCGAYLRAPEPATLYRMHGLMTGAYDVAHLAIRNRVALTNKTPTGLNRGFGGPQVFFALETLMRRVAEELGLDPLAVMRRNLVPSDPIPYRGGGRRTLRLRRLSGPRRADRDRGRSRRAARPPAFKAGTRRASLRGRLRRDRRDEHLQHGVHHHRCSRPRFGRGPGPKDGAVATATVSLDPGGAATRDRRVRAPGSGPPHGARPGGGVRFSGWPPKRGRRQPRARHPDARLVHRLRQLLEPLRGRGGGSGPSRGPPDP